MIGSASRSLIRKGPERCSELFMATHAAPCQGAERLCQTRKISCCRTFGEVRRRLMALFIDSFEAAKIFAKLAFYRRHDLVRKWMTLNGFCRLLKALEVVSK